MATTNMPAGGAPDNPPVPLLPSAGEIDAEITRKLHEWRCAKAEGRY
jgi:hypothetical protein